MFEAARILAYFSAALLVIAIAAWVKLLRNPAPEGIDGGPALRPKNVETASRLLALSFGISAVAATLAVTSWFASSPF